MHPSISTRLRKFTAPFPLSTPVIGVLGIVLLLLGIFTIWQARPLLFWGYNLQRAEAYRAVALSYPEPRQSDSIPIETNAEANRVALGHLAAAIQWRPDDPFAYRLAGESYIAAGDLLNAVSILETGLEQSGDDILIGWQLALAYEQMYQATAETPGENLAPLFADVTPDAPTLPVETPFCSGNDVRSCYSGLATFTHPYAAFPDGGNVTASTLFLHPPARVTIPLEVPTGQPALTFLMGLDPQAISWGTDGATFQLWVVEENGGILPVYERTVIGGELTQGWVPDSIDLTPWAGESIQLALGTTAGPLENNTGDWIGFGNIFLTDGTIAAYRALQAEGRFRNAVENAPIPATQLVARGDEALYASRFDEAAKWYRRAEWAGEDVTSTLAFAQFLETQQNEGWDTALPFLEIAVKKDQGWGSNVNRFYTFFNYGRWLIDEQEYWEAEGYLRVALAIFPEPEHGLYPAVSDAHRFLAISYDKQGRFQEAFEHAQQSVFYNPNYNLTQFQYGYALYRLDQARLPEVEQAFARSLELSSSANDWQTIILAWLEGGNSEQAQRYCETALETYSVEQLGFACWEGDLGASATLFGEYQVLLATGDEDGAYARLAQAIESNGGWNNVGQRFNAWFAWTEYLVEEERFEEAVVAGQTALSIRPEYISDSATNSLNKFVAESYVGLSQYQAALPYLDEVISYGASPFDHFYYGTILYRANPANLAAVRAKFEESLELANPLPEMRIRMIDFWYEMGEVEEAAVLCTLTTLTDTEEALCIPDGATDSSGALYSSYLEWEESDREEATPYLEAAVTLDGGWQRMAYRHNAWAEWGRVLQSEGNYTDAILAYETSLDAADLLVRDDALSIVEGLLGLAYLSEGEIDSAIDAFENAIALDDENAFAYINLARTLYDQDNRDLTRPRELLATALEVAPDDVEVWRSVIGFWSFVNQPAEVALLCAEASPEIRNAIGGVCWDGMGTPSRESFNQYVVLLPTDQTAAIEYLEAAITTDGGWLNGLQRFTGWYYWGVHLLNTQRTEEAVTAFEMAISIAPNTLSERLHSEAYRQWGVALYSLGEYATALTHVETAISIDDTNALAYLLQGQLIYQIDSNRRADTIMAFEEAVRLEPDNSAIWSAQAIFWLEQEEQDELLGLCTAAPTEMQSAIDLQCWDGTTPPSMVYYREFTTERTNGNTEAAFVALESAIEINDGWANTTTRYLAWRAWAARLWEVGRDADAVTAYQTTFEIAPETVSPSLLSDDYFIMGLSLVALERTDDALEAYRQSVTLNSNNPWARLNYGYTLYTSDPANKVPVVEQFTAALTNAPEQLVVWESIIKFWQTRGETEEAANVCREAESSAFVAELAPLCNPS